jgi:hypothetical protein
LEDPAIKQPIDLNRRILMAIKVEFDHAGRTYAVESPSISIWNVHVVARLNNSMTIETDLMTNEKIFVTWSQVGVLRLLSSVDEKGVPIG